MECENEQVKGSKNTMKFLGYFSCFNCREIGNIPYILICNHIYCENCVSNFNMRKMDGSMVCPYCYTQTKKSEILPELDLKLFISNIKSIDDEEFEQKYQSKISFINGNNNSKDNNIKFRDIIIFLLKFFSFEYKQMINKREKTQVHKRNYMELKKDTKNIEQFQEEKLKINPFFKYN